MNDQYLVGMCRRSEYAFEGALIEARKHARRGNEQVLHAVELLLYSVGYQRSCSTLELAFRFLRIPLQAENLPNLPLDLIQELRVLQTGVQFLTGFLLTLPFQQKFAQLSDAQVRLYLGIVAVLPNFFFSMTGGNNQNFPFGGTAVLIMVGVALDTVKQIESQLMQRNYEGFLR